MYAYIIMTCRIDDETDGHQFFSEKLLGNIVVMEFPCFLYFYTFSLIIVLSNKFSFIRCNKLAPG